MNRVRRFLLPRVLPDAVARFLQGHPDVKFEMATGTKVLKNMAEYFGASEDAIYLSGMAAGAATKTGRGATSNASAGSCTHRRPGKSSRPSSQSTPAVASAIAPKRFVTSCVMSTISAIGTAVAQVTLKRPSASSPA